MPIRCWIRAASSIPTTLNFNAIETEVNSLPQIVGGGLNHADWKARRWRPADFKLKTLAENFPAHIDITGANVVDWPL